MSGGNIYFLTDDQREGVLWAIRLGLAYDDGFSFPRDQNREILRSAQSVLDGSWKGQRISHGRHCTCSSCAQEDWTSADLAPCGMHGADCPALYQPWGPAGSYFDPAREAPNPDAPIKPSGRPSRGRIV